MIEKCNIFPSKIWSTWGNKKAVGVKFIHKIWPYIVTIPNSSHIPTSGSVIQAMHFGQ